MARKIYRIDEFMGLDQSAGENGMSPAFSPDACNMDTENGELSVAKGYTRYINEAVPGSDTLHRMHMYRTSSGDQVIAIAGGSVYAYRGGNWVLIYSFSGGLTGGHADFLEADIDGRGYLLIASGEQQIVKYDGSTAALFGSSEALSNRQVGLLALYRGRLFSAGEAANPNRLYWSKLPGSGRSIESWGEEASSPNVSGGHTEIGAGAGDPIVGLAALSNQLLIFKRRSIYRLIGDKPSNFTVEPVAAEAESAAYTSLVTSSDMLYYITKGGLCRFNGVTAGETADARRIRLLLSGADVSESKGAAARNKLYYTFGDSQGGGIIEYDLLRRTYMLRRGFTACDIASWDGRLYILDSDRHVCLFDDGISYDGKKIEAWWRTPKTDLFDKSGVKAMRSLCFRGCSLAGETALCAEVSVGGGKSSARVLLSEEEDEVTELPLKNQGRSFSLRLSNEAGGRFSLRGGLELSFESWRRTE